MCLCLPVGGSATKLYESIVEKINKSVYCPSSMLVHQLLIPRGIHYRELVQVEILGRKLHEYLIL